jgi:ribosome-binding ATPase YchF (GTP1/OBG family)
MAVPGSWSTIVLAKIQESLYLAQGLVLAFLRKVMMKVGIAGFAGSGKSTVFHWLTGAKPDPSKSQQGQIGKPEIPDERLDWLSQHFKPKKTTPAKLEFLDTPGLMISERRDNPRRLAILRDCGGLMVVLNGYSPGDLVDELRRFREELLFADLEVVTGRIDRLKDQLKKPRPAKQREADQTELALLERIVAALESGQGAASLGLREEEEKVIRSFQLLTLKRELVFVNIGEDRIGQGLPANLLHLAPTALQAPAKLEMELEDLSEEDRQAFMKDLNVTGFARGDVLRAIFAAMDQIVFFTVGEDECRAWPIPKGASAVEGAGEIHTDLARGFVRGEVVSYADFRKLGSMKEAKQHGVYRLESKTYIVQDGDIMHILAST